MKKLLYLTGGFIGLGLGALGAALPLLPAFAELSRGAAVPKVSDPFYAPL